MKLKLLLFAISLSFTLSAQQLFSPLETSNSISTVNGCGIPTSGDFVINGGFEQYSSLPTTLDQMNRSCGWASPTIGSPDYFHVNGGNSVSIPDNFAGSQTVSSTQGGEAYAGIVFSGGAREMIRTELKDPLEPNTDYQITFEVSLGSYGGGNNSIKFQAFLAGYIQSPLGGELPTEQDPNGILLTNSEFSTTTNGWETITLDFTTGSTAGQDYLYIGAIDNVETSGSSLGYYYIDNVSLKDPQQSGCECGKLNPNILFSINNCSVNAVPLVPSCPNLSQISYSWVFSNGNTYSGQFPPTQNFIGPNGGFNQMTLSISYVLNGGSQICKETVTKNFFVPCRTGGRSSESEITIHPNPAKDNITVSILNSKVRSGSIELMNAFGLTISKTKYDMTEGNTKFNFNVSSLTSGIYFVKFTNENDETEIKRFIKI